MMENAAPVPSERIPPDRVPPERVLPTPALSVPDLSGQTSPAGRLAGRSVILTGAAGDLGRVTSRRFLAEGANLVLTGRNPHRLERFTRELARDGLDTARIVPLAADAADPEACRRAVEEAVARFGRVDVLVNNAGSTGAKQPLSKIPFSVAELVDLGEVETFHDSCMNLLGGPWNMVRAALPHLAHGASIVNVSTIFSRTAYYGRIPYVVPKSALNALSLGLARDLGRSERAIRVNTVFPGPIESNRIHTAFSAMDNLRGVERGTTSQDVLDLMILRRRRDGNPAGFTYPQPQDVASTALWLASEESAAFCGHSFEVTHGMQVPAQSRAKLVSWPDSRLVDLGGRVVLVLGGADLDAALTFAQAQLSYGADVVLTFGDLETLERARHRERAGRARVSNPLHLLHLDPLRRETTERVFHFVEQRYGRLDAVLILPAVRARDHDRSLAEVDDRTAAELIRRGVEAPVAFASALAWFQRKAETRGNEPPAVTFVTGPDDGHGNHFNEVSRAAVEELIRVWRFEEEHDVELGQRRWSTLPNQLVRFDNRQPNNLTFAADWTATLANRVRKMDSINLWIPESIERATGKSSMPRAIDRVLLGLHQGHTALVTGASVGIGKQLARFLAIAGARVVLSARGPEKLEAARAEITRELEHLGYPDPASRVAVLAGVDVGEETALARLVEQATEALGHIDILINNAGIAGAETMVVDMDLAAWERTLEANLVSNFSLIHKLSPQMKAHGLGKILNVSSYFGGEKYVAVAYPNRADYAVSKAGQRALAEILSRHLGPEIQVNALAPGPVDGARLRGTGGQPGLFARRGGLILANKRLNAVHAAILAAVRGGENALHVLLSIAANHVPDLRRRSDLSEPVEKLLPKISRGGPTAPCCRYLVNRAIARDLITRLVVSGVADQAAGRAYLDELVDAAEPFFPDRLVEREARKVQEGIVGMLHLHRMPTDEDVALSTVFYLADDNVSGETFHPSGGLKFDRSVTEGELIGKPGTEELARLAGKNVVLLGEVLEDELVELAEAFAGHGVASLEILTESDRAARHLRRRIAPPDGVRVSTVAISDDIETGLDQASTRLGRIDVVVSTPFARLPQKPLSTTAGGEWHRVLSVEDFRGVVRDQLTHHFRVAKKAALWERCAIVLGTPDTSRSSTREEFALALFVKNALHAFTVTLGVESERIPTTPAVNQVQLTRRARSEEPRNDKEAREELSRFVDAVLQCSLPAPCPQESRYLSRIYRGNAVTV